MKKLSVLLLFSIFCALIRAQEDMLLYGIYLTPAQQQELAELVNRFKIQIKKHCDLCSIGQDSRYKKLTQQEFSHMFKKSALEIEPTIQKIADFYKKVGLSNENIAKEVDSLQASLSCWCGGILQK
jgi:hypothetical protein